MNQDLTTRTIWSKAGISGIALGAVSGVFMFIGQATGSISSPVVSTLLSLLLWLAKFAGCIWLMMFFMKRFSAEFNEADNSVTFRFGTATALCSALIYAAVTLANVLIINPDLISQQLDAAMKIYGSALDSNSLAAMDTVEAIMPQVMFFSNLAYCFLYGTVLSAILSRNIPPRDPFAGRQGNATERENSAE